MIKLRPYQQVTYNEIMDSMPFYDKILIACETGWGKSILIGQLANALKGRTLVLTHRIELLHQNSEWINDLGILTARQKKPQACKDAKSVISMAQTCRARFKKYGPDYIGDFDNVIVDEVHIDFFKEVYLQLGEIKLIAVTATPIRNKTEKKTVSGIDYVRKLSLKDDFDILLQGVKTLELIELGFLTRDFNIQLTPPSLDKLKSSEATPDGYTSKSLTEVFGSHASIDTVLSGYNEYCSAKANNGQPKKTLIFNPTTAVNKKMLETFLEVLPEVDVRLFDSVNKTEHSRKDTVDWFMQTPGAVLLNVGVFSVGFSVNDLEAIIYNKKTKSLSLWLQSIGRGSRILNKLQIENEQVKDSFLVLDMGLNIAEHGKWSDNRDWAKFFVDNPWKRKQETDLLQMWECEVCGYFNLQGRFFNQTLEILECEECHTPKPKPKEKKLIKGEFVVLEKPIYPNANKIMEYVKRVGGDGNLVLKIARTQILDLFKYHTTKEHYIANRGRYVGRIGELYRGVYFTILNQSELKSANKKLTTQLQSILSRVDNFYGY